MRYQAKWLRALGNTGDGVFVVDAAQRIVFWNKGAERLLGYTEGEVLNRSCHEVIAGRLRSGKVWCRSDCEVQGCVQHGIPVHNFDLLTSTKQGQNLCVNVSIIALARQDQSLTLHLMRDVTRREQVVERDLVIEGSPEVQFSDFPFRRPPPVSPGGNSLEDVEVEHIQRTLEEAGWNLSRAARILEIDRTTLYNKVRRYGLKPSPTLNGRKPRGR